MRSIDRKHPDKIAHQAFTRIEQKLNDLELDIRNKTMHLNVDVGNGDSDVLYRTIEIGAIDIIPSGFSTRNQSMNEFNRGKLYLKESDGNLYFRNLEGEEFQLSSDNVKLRGKSSESGSIPYGKLWVKNTTPNELYFTNDIGTSYLISNGSGTILGSQYHHPSSESTYSLTTSFTNIDSTYAKIGFVGPSSNRVLIEIQLFLEEGATATTVYLGLSNNSTYTTVGASYEKNVGYGRNRKKIINCKWVVSTVSGTSYTYYIGAKASSANGTLKWGGTASLGNPPLIITATAL